MVSIFGRDMAHALRYFSLDPAARTTSSEDLGVLWQALARSVRDALDKPPGRFFRIYQVQHAYLFYLGEGGGSGML